jgi:hypothetical protein
MWHCRSKASMRGALSRSCPSKLGLLQRSPPRGSGFCNGKADPLSRDECPPPGRDHPEHQHRGNRGWWVMLANLDNRTSGGRIGPPQPVASQENSKRYWRGFKTANSQGNERLPRRKDFHPPSRRHCPATSGSHFSTAVALPGGAQQDKIYLIRLIGNRSLTFMTRLAD